MEDKVAIITGANSGIGYQTALDLARRGATVVMACRSEERGEEARARLLAEAPGSTALVLRLDLSEPDSVQAFCREVEAQVGVIDLLVNNAGIVGVPLARNSVGHELQLATNYLGPFALTCTLLPRFRPGAPTRIVNVGSLAHRLGKLRLDDFNWERSAYSTFGAYARSKLALLAFTVELNRRLERRGGAIRALASHPGVAATDIGRYHHLTNPRNRVGRWINERIAARIASAAEAAGPTIHAACAEAVRGGDFFGPGGWLELGGPVAPARLSPLARDEELGRRLWALSEAMTGVRFPASSAG